MGTAFSLAVTIRAGVGGLRGKGDPWRGILQPLN